MVAATRADRVGRDRAYFQIEKIANLDLLPPDGFLISAFPVKLHRGWTRAVAILDDTAKNTASV